MQRHATAVWQGDLGDGNGIISTESHELANARYSFSGRFNYGTGTNPEELLAAAQAGCYSMALSLMLGESGVIAERIDTKVCVSIVPERHGFSINAIHLATLVKAPGFDKGAIETAARNAKECSPASKLFDAEITLDVQIDN